MKYKVGDRVRFHKTADEYSYFGPEFKGFKKIISVDDCSVTLEGGFCYNKNEIRKECENKIVITTDGKETLARLYGGKEVVKSAIAKCSPDDEFDFIAGAKIAFERLQKPKYYSGKIVCVESEYPTFTAGKIYDVTKGIFKDDWGNNRPSCPAFRLTSATSFNTDEWKFIELKED